MDATAFHQQVTELEDFLTEALTYFFAQRGITFDPAELAGEGSTDLTTLAKEAHFYGADLYPDDAPANARTICA